MIKMIKVKVKKKWNFSARDELTCASTLNPHTYSSAEVWQCPQAGFCTAAARLQLSSNSLTARELSNGKDTEAISGGRSELWKSPRKGQDRGTGLV